MCEINDRIKRLRRDANVLPTAPHSADILAVLIAHEGQAKALTAAKVLRAAASHLLREITADDDTVFACAARGNLDRAIAAFDATRKPDTAEAFKKLREAHVDAGSPLDGVDPTTTYPPQPHEDRPGSTP